ncbi:MAG: hypothetical protein ACFFBD_15210, partial [Candidatus Hodarchaeota archaeon]
AWLYENRDVENLNHENLTYLKVQITNLVLEEQMMIDSSLLSDSIYITLSKNIDFLNTIGHSLGRPLRLCILGSISGIFPIFQKAIGQNFSALCAMNRSIKGNTAMYRFRNLLIEIQILEPDEIIDFKENVFLTNVAPWKEFPKEFDGILLIIKIPGNDEIITKNIKKIVQQTPNKCPISLVIDYDSHYHGEISDTPIPNAISETIGRTISLLETKANKKIIETALIDIVEKMVLAITNLRSIID